MATYRDFIYEEATYSIDETIKKAFDEDGFIIVRNILNSNEVKRIKDVLESEEIFTRNISTRDDGQGKAARMSVWNHPGNDVTGMVARCEKIVTTMEQLLSGEVYHYHTKVIMKEAFTGGAFLWHQDYGYWYDNGLLFPDVATVFIALDEAVQENGCLQILRGSHKAGRIDHVPVATQIAADPERVQQLAGTCESLHVELRPGDAIFFHCNLLHRSAQNRSPKRRWAFLCSYNKATNNPIIAHHHPQYNPLSKVPNSAIMTAKTEIDEMEKWFFKDLSEVITVTTLREKKTNDATGI